MANFRVSYCKDLLKQLKNNSYLIKLNGQIIGVGKKCKSFSGQLVKAYSFQLHSMLLQALDLFIHIFDGKGNMTKLHFLS